VPWKYFLGLAFGYSLRLAKPLSLQLRRGFQPDDLII
jgi:hypothetical protein